ncbi:MAG: hypothetical protein PHN77_20770 [Thermoguttaceae bacterium]|nr:hypothetical protein [Thermoguttaceae bacterium]MDI9446413.1 hypothetical protein [Planctomycetota bacterium]
MNSDRDLPVADRPSSRAAHRAAWVLACAVFPLIWMGGLVTTYSAGMAVPDWPSTYGYNLFLYPLASWLEVWDVFLEHGHRLLGAAVGLSTVWLAILLWRRDSRRLIRWLGVIALGGVCLQGTLGGLRVTGASIRQMTIAWTPAPLFLSASAGLFALAAQVVLACGAERRRAVFWVRSAAVSAGFSALAWFGVEMARDQLFLAKLHGSTAPAFFALAACLITLTSPGWIARGHAQQSASAGRVQLLAVLVTGMIYLQIVLGVNLRHIAPDAAPWWFLVWVWLHLIVAGAAAVLIVWQWLAVRKWAPPKVTGRALLLVGLFLLQLALGATAWVTNYGWPLWFTTLILPVQYTVVAEGLWQVVSTTAHVGVGSLCLAVAASTALWSRRLLAAASAAARDAGSTDAGQARRTPRR